ncbi:Rho GDP-dissociation inhibitor 1 [Citrus sinensis]|uniref:Rho GDP-dissociation inhibitor 1 n=2 Tax=Citrus TaxID=2706 RepID=A0ACB8N6S9_CITSI|nr:Rho GDP-dissociation inhibitor 1 [Citrus sinensis]
MVDEKRDEGENSNVAVGAAEPANLQEEQRTSRYVTVSETDEEDDDDREQDIQLGPQYTLKEQIEKDKDDESLRKWKEQLLGSVDFDNIGETLEPEVRILSLSIVAPGRNDIVLAVPEDGKPTGNWFTLKEGSKYSLKFTFEVSNNIVSGLKYTNTVWKAGIKGKQTTYARTHANFLNVIHSYVLLTTSFISVDSAKQMLGTFSPQPEPYIHEMPEETTPSGMFARGSYSARTKFLDDDNKCYLEINYSFDIRKEWAAV